jgi:hypothetical protein
MLSRSQDADLFVVDEIALYRCNNCHKFVFDWLWPSGSIKNTELLSNMNK